MNAQTRINDGIADRFEAALAQHPMAAFGAVSIRIEGAKIALFGSVETLEQKVAIYDVIEDFPVIRDVEDHLVYHAPVVLPLAA